MRDRVHNILMRNWVHCIYPQRDRIQYISHEWWSPQYLLLNDEVHSIYPMTDGVQGIYLWHMETIGFIVGSDRVHSIYSLEIWIEQRLLVKKCSPHNLLNRVNSIDTQYMESTAFSEERWSPQHLHMRDAIVALLSFPAVRGGAGNDTGHWFLFPILLLLH